MSFSRSSLLHFVTCSLPGGLCIWDPPSVPIYVISNIRFPLSRCVPETNTFCTQNGGHWLCAYEFDSGKAFPTAMARGAGWLLTLLVKPLVLLTSRTSSGLDSGRSACGGPGSGVHRLRVCPEPSARPAGSRLLPVSSRGRGTCPAALLTKAPPAGPARRPRLTLTARRPASWRPHARWAQGFGVGHGARGAQSSPPPWPR